MYYHRILGLKQYLTFSICFWSKYFEDRVANELNVAVFLLRLWNFWADICPKIWIYDYPPEFRMTEFRTTEFRTSGSRKQLFSELRSSELRGFTAEFRKLFSKYRHSEFCHSEFRHSEFWGYTEFIQYLCHTVIQWSKTLCFISHGDRRNDIDTFSYFYDINYRLMIVSIIPSWIWELWVVVHVGL